MIETLKSLPLLKEDLNFIEAIEAQASTQALDIAVLGSFSVGKSALINALIGEGDTLPTHTNETTAIPTYVSGTVEDKVEIEFVDGRNHVISGDELHSLVAGGQVEGVSSIRLSKTSPDWLQGVTIIDTPGRNTKFKAHIEASESALLSADVIIYVMPWQGLTLEDIVYIKHILLYQPNLHFIINKIDRVDERQGVSIEELVAKVTTDLFSQLGKVYPVHAVSAATGQNVELVLNLIASLKKKMKAVKKRRFDHALHLFLLREQSRVSQQIKLLELALFKDESKLETEKQELHLQFEEANLAIVNQIDLMQKMLYRTGEEVEEFIHSNYLSLETRLKSLINQGLSVDVLTLKIEDEVLTTRNTIFKTVQEKLQNVTGESFVLTLNEEMNQSVNFKMTEPDLFHLQQKHDAERQRLLKKVESVATELQYLPVETIDEEKYLLLTQEIEGLTDELVERYIPQYIIDESANDQTATKIASAIGFVGDIGLAIGLAAVTAGASAGVQVLAKGAGKTAVKQTSKEITKKLAKEAALKAAKQAMKDSAKKATTKLALEATGKMTAISNEIIDRKAGEEIGEDSQLLRAVKTFDQVTSPVQTLAKKIGQNIDEQRRQPPVEDTQYRRDFFARKHEMEIERDKRLSQLKELEEKVSTNEKLRQDLQLKRQKIEKSVEQEIVRLQNDYDWTLQELKNRHMNKEVERQIHSIVSEEQENVRIWFKSEFGTVSNAIEQMVPAQLNEQLDESKKQIEKIERLKEQGNDRIELEIQASRHTLQEIEMLLDGEHNELSI
ncbi:dynamin family protein [Exiguobacterium sp. KJ 601]|uniref:dynamin family protein n=1 Tax=Exiguobacterium sp. KJ 601 TaxID=2782569 RepID=UPI0022AE7F7C|nr:dynamin family protein [Exiguobacterium sp. KJ 601]